jgi:hypothetical protein
MKVRYVNDIKDTGRFSYYSILLKEGKEYIVYGIEQINEFTYYLIVPPEEDSYYPHYYDVRLFQIVDHTLSMYWQVDCNNGKLRILFEDWIKTPNYMQYFIEGNVEEEDAFYKLNEFIYYQRLIDEEFK